MIDLIQFSMLFTGLLAAIITLHLLWSSYRLQHRCDIEPIEVAEPEIAAALQQLLVELSQLAGVTTPKLFIRRAALPNAFVIATIVKQDIYLTDELLESCNEQDDPLTQLTFVLCHEISHIKHNDAMILGLLHYADWILAFLHVKYLQAQIYKKNRMIEQHADASAHHLLRQMQTSSNKII